MGIMQNPESDWKSHAVGRYKNGDTIRSKNYRYSQYSDKNAAVIGEMLYDHEVDSKSVNMNVTRKEFDGDYSVVVFPYTKAAKKKPEQIGEELGEYLVGKYG